MPIRTETVTVTPEQASAWLQNSADVQQRSLNVKRVSAYASAMQRGQWRVTHQPVAIDPAGKVLDGQHRLSAVVMAKQPVPMAVAFDVPNEIFDVIDTGHARTAASILHIAGHADANALAAGARAILMYREIDGTRRMPTNEIRGQITARDVLDYVEAEEGDILRGNLKSVQGMTRAFGRYGARSWLAAAFTLIDVSRPDSAARDEFLERAETGAMLPPGSPILSFRRWMTGEHGYARTSGHYRGAVGIAGTLKAWNAFVNGHELALIRVRPGRERWPVVGRDDIDAEDAADFADDADTLDLIDA